MHYIVLDLEWNQPLSFNSAAYRETKGNLLFEMIQIGAVKLNEARETVDSFSRLIQPAQYIKIHPRIRRITGITQDDLAGAPAFAEAMGEFVAWCGPDCALLTWGCDDISVLSQNMAFFGFDSILPPGYDLQRLFGAILGSTKERKGLKAAMDYYHLEAAEDMCFHNALNDAHYTSRVFACFPDAEAVLRFPMEARPLVHTERRKQEKRDEIPVRRISEALRSATALTPACSVCNRQLPLSEGYVHQHENDYMALADCPAHGLLFVRLQFAAPENGKRRMTRIVSVSDEQSDAYVHTKHLQWQQKLLTQAEEPA
jgi:inhibitor of KinA sporulation pathway (predicted exonuclease)